MYILILKCSAFWRIVTGVMCSEGGEHRAQWISCHRQGPSKEPEKALETIKCTKLLRYNLFRINSILSDQQVQVRSRSDQGLGPTKGPS